MLTAGASSALVSDLTAAQREAVVARFVGLVADLAAANGSRLSWWSTWLSCRDRLNSTVVDRLVAVAAARTLDEVPCLDGATGAAAAAAAGAAGRRVVARRAVRARWAWSALRRRSASWRAFGAVLVAAARAAVLDRRHGGRPPSDVDVLLVSILERRNVTTDGWEDAYFGPLADVLVAEGERVLTIAHLRNTTADLLAAGAAATPPVVSVARFLRPSDLLAAAVAGARLRIDLRPAAELRELVAAALEDERASVALGHLLHRGLRRALEANPRARVIHPFENNAWERACDLAAQDRPVVGYLHPAVVPAHLKYRFEAGELDRPQPDLVVCTGPAAREVLLSLGSLDPSIVADGCALRNPSLPVPVTERGPVRTVLVLLEGLWTMVPLVRLVAEAAQARPDVRFVLRGHPALPAASLVERAGTTIAGNLELSTEPDGLDDLRRADVVVYKGTTMALTAAAMGIPRIHVDTGELLDDDPLFRCAELGRSAASAGELVAALDAFDRMDDGSWRAEAAAARGYVERYLAPVTSSALAPFRRAR